MLKERFDGNIEGKYKIESTCVGLSESNLTTKRLWTIYFMGLQFVVSFLSHLLPCTRITYNADRHTQHTRPAYK